MLSRDGQENLDRASEYARDAAARLERELHAARTATQQHMDWRYSSESCHVDWQSMMAEFASDMRHEQLVREALDLARRTYGAVQHVIAAAREER